MNNQYKTVKKIIAHRIQRFALLLVFFLSLYSNRSIAQNTMRVYFVGNSVTDAIKYDGLKSLAESAGKTHTWARHMIPGAPLEFLWNNPTTGFTEVPYGPPSNAFPNYDWDAISLQPFDRLIEGANMDKDIVNRYIDLAKTRNPNAQFYLYMRWPRTPDSKSPTDPTLTAQTWNTLWARSFSGGWDNTNESKDFFEDLLFSVRSSQTISKPVLIVPVGEVFKLLNDRMAAGQIAGYTKIWDFYSDGIHLKDVGSYAVATTYYATLYKADPRGLSVPSQFGTIPSGVVSAIQNAVWEVVSTYPYSGVSSSSVAVTGVTVSPSTVTLSNGQTAQLVATVSPSNATNKTVSWSSSNNLVATVSSTGLVTATGAGSATITVTTADGGRTATASVTVSGSSGGGGTNFTGTLASWETTGTNGAATRTPTSTASGITVSPLSFGAGLLALNFVDGTGFTARNQTMTTLANAISDGEYISFTITPGSGNSVSITKIDLRGISQNRARSFALFSSVGGFAAANVINTFSVTNYNNPLQAISLTGHSSLTAPVEFRLYMYGYTDQWESVGVGMGSGDDLIVTGSISGGNTPPTAPTNLTASSIRASTLTLSWTHATDNVGVTGYDVFQGSTKLNSTLITTNTFNVTGLATCTDYGFSVRAYDVAGANATSAVLNVKSNCAPTAVIAATPVTGTAPLAVNFNGTNSTDPDGSVGDFVLGYEWNFGDGTPLDNSNSPVHTYTTAGTYTVTLRVVDNRELYSAPVTATIIVNSSGGGGSATTIQAENYASVNDAVVAANHTGFNGTGFLDYGGNGSYGQWNYTASSAGSVTLDVRYGLFNAVARPCNVLVNGVSAGSLNFDNTGAWTTWGTKSISINVNAGANTIRLVATTSNGGPNIDQLTLTGAAPVTYILSTTAANGTVTKSPNKSNYTSGETVSLTATPSTGYQFSSWSGDITGTTNPVNVVMNSNKTVTANFTAIPTSTNLLSNGEFDTGSTGWSSIFQGGATGSFSVVTDAAMSGANAGRVTITNGGTANWNVELYSLFNLQAGKSYEVSFRAKAESNREALVIFQKNGDPYNDYWTQTVNLTTTDQTFGPFVYTSTISDANTRLNFKVGGNNADVWVDAVIVREIPTPNSITVSPSQLNFLKPAASQNVTVTANVSWSVTKDQTWITVTPLSGTSNGTITVSVSENTGTTSRTGTVTISGSGITRTVNVSQSSQAATTWPAVGMGLDGFTWYTNYSPFNNVVKLMRWNNVGSWDSRGYPASAVSGRVVEGWAGFDNGYTFPAGNYVVTWEGAGDVTIFHNASLVSENLTGAVKRREYYINPGAAGNIHGVLMKVNSFPATNIKVFLPGQESNTSFWNPAYTAYLEPFRGSVLRFMNLNGTNGSTQVNWSDRTPKEWSSYTNENDNSASWGVKGKASYESMIQLANQMDCDMWICIPHLATPDYISKLARLIKTGIDEATGQQVTEPLRSDLNVWLEYSNEVWNTGGDFSQTAWFASQTGTQVGSAAFNKAYSEYAVARFQTFRTAFGDNSRVRRIIACQTDYGVGQYSSAYERLKDINYPADYDALANTTYFGYDYHTYIYNNWNNGALTHEQFKNHIKSQIGTGAYSMTESGYNNQRTATTYWAAQQFGAPVVSYEGNEHFDMVRPVNGTSLSDLIPASVNWMHQFVRSSHMTELMEANHLRHRASGLTTHMPFVMLGGWSKFGQWGHVEYVGQTVNQATKYKWLLDHYNLPYPNLSGARVAAENEVMTNIAEEEVIIYPNPANGILHINGFDLKTNLIVFNIAGKPVLRGKGKSIDVSSLPAGLYLLDINGKRVRFIKE